MGKSNEQIVWSKDDYRNLRNAINRFNRKIDRVTTEESKLYLPEKLNYKQVKNNITTQKELERYIKSISRFSSTGAEEVHTFRTGEQITEWEYKELLNLRQRAVRRISNELSEVNDKLKSQANHVNWSDLENLKMTLEGTLENMKDLSKLKGYDFKREVQIIKNQGVSDYKMKRARDYQKFYYSQVLPNMKNFKSYNALKSKLDSFKNPIDFYNFISQSEMLNDPYAWIDSPERRGMQDFEKQEAMFENELQNVGLK